ncbi:hypothetical protein OPQ81_000581 [Rhizoctonia solani]|nr:hypothetical protein OPQ81_000581 [Rhizoctonia solani]
MSSTKLKPGPRRTSCLTCWQRRKKCDLSRPFCERCLKGGFNCLGYADGNHRREDPSVPSSSRSQPIPAQEASSETFATVTIGLPQAHQISSGTDTDRDPRFLIPGAALLHSMPSVPVANDDQTSIYPLEILNCSWSQDRSQPARHQPSTHRPSRAVERLDGSFNTRHTSDYLRQVTRALCRSIPPSVNVTQTMRERHFEHVINEYQSQRFCLWFMVPPTAIRDGLVAQLKRSKVTIWAMSLGARIYQALGQDPHSPTVQGYISWIDKLEHKFTADPRGNLPMNDIADRLFAYLELAYLKFVTLDNCSGYTLLQKALPGFLQLVATDTNLYVEHPNGNLVVSFPRTLGSSQYELKRFVMCDTIAALVLGVPPLVEYAYNGECDPESHGLEWIHGVPVTLIKAISQVNSWRSGSRVTLDDWQALERCVLAWEPQPVNYKPDGEDSATGSVARLAVQESWRHVVLIYIYMGMCGVSSHDPRVQASILQIVKIGETVANLPIGIHMFTHCLVVSRMYRSSIRKAPFSHS